MKAIVQHAYGSSDVLKIEEVEQPTVGEEDLLVKVHASCINAGDVFTMRGSPWLIRLTLGLRKPKTPHILGWDMAGEVVEVGSRVTKFQAGDKVYGKGEHTFADFACAEEKYFAPNPSNLTFQQAAAIPTAALTALQALRDHGRLQSGQTVLINGASGGVGSFAVQIAKSMGAEVTGVCSTAKIEIVRSLGADHVIDYSKDDFTRRGDRYDIILDNAASHSFSDLKKVLTPDGIILPNSGHGGMRYVVKGFALSPFQRHISKPWMMQVNNADLLTLKELIESGKVAPVIDKTFPLEETPQAIDYYENGYTRGKIVITTGGQK